MSEPLTISVEDAARLLGISRGLAYESARRGELPTIRLGRRLLVPRQRLLELVSANVGTGNGRSIAGENRAP
jgi:excisionase family DNA binding protein